MLLEAPGGCVVKDRWFGHYSRKRCRYSHGNNKDPCDQIESVSSSNSALISPRVNILYRAIIFRSFCA